MLLIALLAFAVEKPVATGPARDKVFSEAKKVLAGEFARVKRVPPLWNGKAAGRIALVLQEKLQKTEVV